MNKKAKRIILLLSFIMTISIIGNISILYKKDTPPKETNRTVAMYIENDNGGYDLSSQTSFPTDGYILNTEKSSCRNGGTISQDLKTKKLSVSVTNKDECTLYFDKVTPIDIIKESSNGVKTVFDSPATTDEGIFEMEDDYGTSYYYRGAVENNYLKYGVNAKGQEM